MDLSGSLPQINLGVQADLEEEYSPQQAMFSDVPIPMSDVVEGLKLVVQACVTHAVQDSSQVRMLAIILG
ncbi:hypothetical protein TNCV_5096981 [Trichonephila clavipes]|nr:hypothetical protein TNCV_5096981 [Trichonephila clavipes]